MPKGFRKSGERLTGDYSLLHRKILAALSCFAMLFLLACNGTDTDKNKVSDSTASNGQSTADTSLSDNEVRYSAPDADAKTEQGYALPRHGDKLAQSPIDIMSGKTDRAGKEQVSFVFHSDIESAKNLGHTIELEFKEGSKCTMNGTDYACKQFHFHTPSEHMVDGMTYPMEMHIVNAWTDSANKVHNLVVAVLFKIGSENKFIKEFLEKVPAKEGEKNELNTGEANLGDLMAIFTKNGVKSCYSYDGSLTTPPFSENVHWIVMKDVVEASEDQIMGIEKLEGNNARHVQAINDRIVYSQ